MISNVVGLSAQLMMGIFWTKDAIRQKTDSASPGVYWASILKVMSVVFHVIGAGVFLAGITFLCLRRLLREMLFSQSNFAAFYLGLIISYALLGIAEIFDLSHLKLNAPAEEGANSDFVEKNKAQRDNDDYEDDADFLEKDTIRGENYEDDVYDLS